MDHRTETTRTVREQALEHIRNHPEGVRTYEVHAVLDYSLAGLTFQLERLQTQGLIWRDQVGHAGKWFPVAPGEEPPPPPVSSIRARQYSKILALVDRQGYVTNKDATRELGLASTSMGGRRLNEMAERGQLVPCDTPEGVRANVAWTRPSNQDTTPVEPVAPRPAPHPHPDRSRAEPHTHPEVLAARRIQAAHAMTKALEAVTDPTSAVDLDDAADHLAQALDSPLRAHLAADLEEWARREDSDGNSIKAHTLRQVCAWITRTVTTLDASL